MANRRTTKFNSGLGLFAALVLSSVSAACATGSGEGVGDDIGPMPIDARADSTSTPTDAPVSTPDARVDAPVSLPDASPDAPIGLPDATTGACTSNAQCGTGMCCFGMLMCVPGMATPFPPPLDCIPS